MILEINKFNMKILLDKSPLILILGRRDTGKSFLIQDLVRHQPDITTGSIVSNTKFSFEHPISISIHTKFDKNIVSNLFNPEQKRSLLVLDNCMYDTGWFNDTVIRNLFTNGTHYKQFRIISLPYAIGLPPTLRNHIDYVFIFREPLETNRKAIYRNYGNMFPTFESFCMVMDQLTENYECLVIDNKKSSCKLSDRIFWYKA